MTTKVDIIKNDLFRFFSILCTIVGGTAYLGSALGEIRETQAVTSVKISHIKEHVDAQIDAIGLNTEYRLRNE